MADSEQILSHLHDAAKSGLEALNAAVKPDGPGLTSVGTPLAAGTSITLPSPFTLRAPVRNASAIPAGATEDTAQWSNLLHVEIPILP